MTNLGTKVVLDKGIKMDSFFIVRQTDIVMHCKYCEGLTNVDIELEMSIENFRDRFIGDNVDKACLVCRNCASIFTTLVNTEKIG